MCAQDYSAEIGVALEDIDAELRPASQMRARFDDEAVESYAAILDSLPPVLLIYDPSTRKHWVTDGGHRLTGARLKKRKQIKAKVKTGSYLEAFQEAAHANDANPVRVTNADKRHRVEVALKLPEMKDWSNRRIADACGVHHKVVGNLRPDASELDTVSSSKTVGRDGKARERKKRKKPKTAVNRTPQPDTPTPPTPEPVISSPESDAIPPVASGDSKPPAQTDKQRVNGLFADDETTPSPTEPEEEPEAETECSEATDGGLIDWDELWEPERRLILQRYREWPEGAGAAFVMRLELLAVELRRKYHPEIQAKNNVSLL